VHQRHCVDVYHAGTVDRTEEVGRAMVMAKVCGAQWHRQWKGEHQHETNSVRVVHVWMGHEPYDGALQWNASAQNQEVCPASL